MRETIFENGLRVPADVNALFDELLEPYATADARGVRGDVAPFLTRNHFDEIMLSIDEVREAMNSVSRNADDHDRMLSLLWSGLPDWAKSREAFEKRWRVRVVDPRVMMSPGFVRGRVDEALACLQEPEPALAFGT